MSDKIIHTRKRYLVLALVFVLLGLGVVFLPDNDNKKDLDPEYLLTIINDNSRFISTDEIADKLINNDPSVILIDVRSKEDYDKGSLPGALNIPLKDILGDEANKVFKRKDYDKVIFSNNDIIADQGWTLIARNQSPRTFILKGGINEWVSTIINPVEPGEAAPTEIHELFDFRKGAARYFAGQSKAFEFIDVEESKSTPVKSTAPARSKSKSSPVLPPAPVEEVEEEGC